MVLPPLSHPDATASGCLGFALWIRPEKVDSTNGIILFRLYTLSRHSNRPLCLFLMSFFIVSDNIYFSRFNSSYAGCNHSGFREIILFSPGQAAIQPASAFLSLPPYPACCKALFCHTLAASFPSSSAMLSMDACSATYVCIPNAAAAACVCLPMHTAFTVL